MVPDFYKHMKWRGGDDWARYLTFSCVGQLPLFHRPELRDLFVQHLFDAASRLRLLGWVVMPEHVHLLAVPHGEPLVGVLRRLKSLVARDAFAWWQTESPEAVERLTRPDGTRRFWERGGGHDRLVSTHHELEVKRRYTDANPVRRGLVARPQDWAWSSARTQSWDARPVDPGPILSP